MDRDTGQEINESKSYIKTLHEELGYGPMPNTIINSKKIRKGKVVYDVNYTIDKKGHRITGDNSENNINKESVLFFGCSFTYGEGVQDDESMPYAFNLSKENKYNVTNFGFSGYGAHQMLSILENNIEKESIEGSEVKHVFYQAILDHINRAAFAGYPKYIMDNQNKLHFLKKEEDAKSKNVILEKLASANKRKRSEINDHDRDLFLQIIKKSKDLVKEKYKSDFTVILWDLIKDNDELIPENEYNLKYITKGLEKLNIKYILISDVLSGYKDNSKQFTIKGDGHPSPLAHKKIAQYLVNNIIDK